MGEMSPPPVKPKPGDTTRCKRCPEFIIQGQYDSPVPHSYSYKHQGSKSYR